MPGRPYGDAFALLEKSFNDSSFMKAYQSLPVKQQDERTSLRPPITNSSASSLTTSTTTTTTTTTTAMSSRNGLGLIVDHDRDDTSDDEGSMHEGYGTKVTPPLVLSRNNSGLPPTPPSQLRETPADTAHLVPLPLQRSGISTPVQQLGGPPTPDLTPPSTRQKTPSLAPARPPMPQFASSSRAESFVTAREDRSVTSAHTSQLSLPQAETASGRSWLDSTREVRLGSLLRRLPNGEYESEGDGDGDGDVTPTKERAYASLRDRANEQSRDLSNSPRSLENAVTVAASSTDTGNTTPLRNVTLRKKRRQLELHDEGLQLNGKPLRETRPSQPKEIQATSREVNGPPSYDEESHSSTFGDEADGWHTTVNDMLYRAIREEKAKRLSTTSQTSTTIEAMVITGPQQKKRTLRRAGKNLALREDVSSTPSSPASASNLGHARSLRHKKTRIPDCVNLPRNEIRAVTNPERRRQDRVEVIVIPERRASLAHTMTPQSRSCQETPLLTGKQHRLHHMPSGNVWRASLEAEHNRTSPDSQPEAFVSHQSHVKTPAVKKAPGGLRHVSAPLPSNRSPTTPAQEASSRTTIDSESKLDLSPPTSWIRHSNHNLSPVSPISESHLLSPPLDSPGFQHDYTADDSARSAAKKSSNLSTQAVFEYIPASPRRSVDQSHANARYLHSSQTPGSLSQFSDPNDVIDINEAQAVSLFPHCNNSLIVVQHLSSDPRIKGSTIDTTHSPADIDDFSTPSVSDESEDSSTEARSLRPIFSAVVDAPSTPPVQAGQSDALAVDSPLRNPRPAPMPPVIVIPPTPVPQLDEEQGPDSSNTGSKPPGAPERRPSLVQRARRYSESFIQPFFPLRLTEGRRSSLQRPSSSHDRDHTLHPFWRPRGFWDDFSSDDSELEEYENYLDPDPEHDRLPPGGDTSDVASLKRKHVALKWPRKMSVRMPGFKGNGGFLVGNSLGIGRHGTNNRRHYVSTSLIRRQPSKDHDMYDDDNGQKGEGHKRRNSLPNFSLPFFSNTGGPELLRTSSTLRSKQLSDHHESFTSRSDAPPRQRALRPRASQRNLRRRRLGYKIPGLNVHMHMQVLSVKGIREKLEEKRVEKEERRREIRRKQLKESIGSPMVLE